MTKKKGRSIATVTGLVGGGARRSRDATIPEISVAQLVDYFSGFVGVAKKLGFAGVTLHFNNLELLITRGDEEVRRFFDDVRDILQKTAVTSCSWAAMGYSSESSFLPSAFAASSSASPYILGR